MPQSTLTVPVCGSHTSPPLHPPSRQEFGPCVLLKSQPRRPYRTSLWSVGGVYAVGCGGTQMRPAFQLFGTLKETVCPAACSHL